MFENLRYLYKHYGGLWAVASSSYFWIAIFFTLLSYPAIGTISWAKVALSIFPSLAGFTIAAFAIIFAILDESMLKALMKSDDEGKSPISAIASAIGHAVFIQVAAIILAVGFNTVDAASFIELVEIVASCTELDPKKAVAFLEWTKSSLSALGLLLTYYGALLVLAAVLSIVRMQIIVSDSTN